MTGANAWLTENRKVVSGAFVALTSVVTFVVRATSRPTDAQAWAHVIRVQGTDGAP